MTAYPSIIKGMTRYISAKYPNKNSANQRDGKKGDINGKKRDDPKFEDKDSNMGCTVGAQVENTTPTEVSAAPI